MDVSKLDDARARWSKWPSSKLVTIAEENYFSRPRHDGRLRHRQGARYPPGLLTRAGAAVSPASGGNVTEDQYGELKEEAVEAKRG